MSSPSLLARNARNASFSSSRSAAIVLMDSLFVSSAVITINFTESKASGFGAQIKLPFFNTAARGLAYRF
jgi:hypothetical protein